jgi:hypothetical protein
MNTLTLKSFFRIFLLKRKPFPIKAEETAEKFFYFFLKKGVDRVKKV